MTTPTSSIRTDQKAVLLFDGHCALCRKSVGILQRLDWLRQIHYQNCREFDKLPHCAVPLTPERLLEEMHLVTPDRQRVYHGYRAFRWLAWRLPLLWAVAPLLYIPGVPSLGQRFYLWVARNRFRLVPCSHGVCELPHR
jgi:predicted DCC family thiol-disulfide oxidoreductase YuxK